MSDQETRLRLANVRAEAELYAVGMEEQRDRAERAEAERDAAVKALRYARDCISSPTRPFAEQQDIYDTPMMAKAMRVIDAALASLSAADTEPGGEG